MLLTENDEVADIVEFDIAVTVERSAKKGSGSESTGGGGLKIAVASGEVKRLSTDNEDSAMTKSHVSRVKFRIPVQFRKG